jgi:predicted SnoaL-like aldol condensation-catalyzing enzyme
MNDGLPALLSALSEPELNDDISIKYERNHRLLAEGNFVLSAYEGFLNISHSSFYDLFRVSEGKIVEHWDTTETIPPRNEWNNKNGKF